MTFTQLQYFIAIANTESMTKAAETLNIVQPALSRTIQRLEHELGTTLFTRKGKSIALNENGKVFLQFAEQCVNTLNHVHSSFLREDKGMKGSLSIGTLIDSTVIRKAVVAFQKLYPNINLEIVKLSHAAEANTLDFVIASSDFESSQFSDSFYSCELWQESIVLLVSTKHPFAKRHIVKLSDLKDFPFITPLRTDFTGFSKKFFEMANFTPISYLSTNDQSLVFELVCENQAVALLPEYNFPDDFKDDLCFLRISVPEYIRHVSLYWPTTKNFNDLKETFHNFLVNYYQINFNKEN
ncbi:MAG: LysR family transcriptional regulator [Hespellia sp.]|nr:LysR family transcriptional regulator [Hespellia sp.]